MNRRRTSDLTDEIGIQGSLTDRLGTSWTMWAGQLITADVGRLSKRAEVEKHHGRRKMGIQLLRWDKEGFLKDGGD